MRTDKPEAEIGLFDDNKQLAYSAWTAHRELAETIHLKIKELLESQDHSLTDIGGIVAFKGPGSFTGLRIGLSVANALAYARQVPIVAMLGEHWLKAGLTRLQNSETDGLAQPEYGSPPHITMPRK